MVRQLLLFALAHPLEALRLATSASSVGFIVALRSVAEQSPAARRFVFGAMRIAGVVLSWARALGEFGATITFAGNFPGRTQTMPLATYLALESDPEAALVLSLVMVAVSFVVLVGLRDRWLGAVRSSRVSTPVLP